MSAVPVLERLLQREGAITASGLFLLWALASIYIATGAGLGMDVFGMSALALSPQQHSPDPMPAMAGADMAGMGTGWSPWLWMLMVGMWWTMMIAMMTPSAAPTILLYARVRRHAEAQGQIQMTRASTAEFAAGYFLVWLLFSIVAAALYQALERAGIMSAITMQSQLRWLSGTTLVVTGLYQLSPLKNACLSHCRAPAAFLSRHWRPGALAAMRLGAMHGVYCLGCCGLLMTLLFVGGVMNLAWIALLTLLVMAEKLLSGGPWVGRGAGIVLVAWGCVVLLR